MSDEHVAKVKVNLHNGLFCGVCPMRRIHFSFILFCRLVFVLGVRLSFYLFGDQYIFLYTLLKTFMYTPNREKSKISPYTHFLNKFLYNHNALHILLLWSCRKRENKMDISPSPSVYYQSFLSSGRVWDPWLWVLSPNFPISKLCSTAFDLWFISSWSITIKEAREI